MPKNRIEINGTIDRWGYGSNYFRYMLKGCQEGAVTVLVNSYGGDLNEAIAIGNQIAEHGDVTVEYVAYNASAATVIGLYAKKSIIHSDGLFMIHKTSTWVNTWGQMNEDQIDQAIEELTSQKNMVGASTLQLAKSYHDKSGKPVADILKMMKEEKWLTPEEAVSNGFVDEIIESKCKKKKVTGGVAAIYASAGIPLPEECVSDDPDDADRKSFLDSIQETIRGCFGNSKNNNTNPQNNIEMDKQFTHLNRVLNVEGFEIQDGKITITLNQLTAFNQAIETATSERKTAGDDLKTVTDLLDTIDDSIKNAVDASGKVSAVKALIEKKPGVAPSTRTGPDNHPGSGDGVVLDEVNNFFNNN